MSILYVASVLPKRSETFVYREVLGLADRGHTVHLASVRPPERGLGDPRLEELAERANVIYRGGLIGAVRRSLHAARAGWVRWPHGITETSPAYWPKYQFQIDAGYALAHQLRRCGIAHVHAHMAHVPTTIAMACAAGLRVPFSFTGHAADLFRDRSGLKAKLRRAAFVACISEWHAGFYRGLVPREEQAYPVIRCGVPWPETPAGFEAGRGLVAVGRLVPKKGFDVLLDALSLIPEDRRPALMLIGDGPERKALEQHAKRLRLMETVTFTGAMDNAQIMSTMRDAAAVVLPCRVSADGDRDGIPVVLMEAMAQGVAVVSGDLPTIRELVRDGQTGVMVPPGDAKALADALTRLLQNADERRRLADAGRAHVIREFGLAPNLDRLETAIRRAQMNATSPELARSPADPARPASPA